MKRFISILLILINLMTISITATSEDYIPSETMITDNECIEIIRNCEERMAAAHQMAEAARALGYVEQHIIIKTAKEQWNKAHEKYNQYIEQYKGIKKVQHKEEYPYAAAIWYYFKEKGFNDYVCAGILGNIMAEVGGQTLNIQYWLGGKNYYGMCQWSRKFHPDAQGLDLDEQIIYLDDTMEYEFNTFGYVYSKGFNYEKFLALENEKEAALAFAKSYERCAKEHYQIRTVNATKAYEYFVG